MLLDTSRCLNTDHVYVKPADGLRWLIFRFFRFVAPLRSWRNASATWSLTTRRETTGPGTWRPSGTSCSRWSCTRRSCRWVQLLIQACDVYVEGQNNPNLGSPGSLLVRVHGTYHHLTSLCLMEPAAGMQSWGHHTGLSSKLNCALKFKDFNQSGERCVSLVMLPSTFLKFCQK